MRASPNPLAVGLVSIAMLVFGQLCAFSSFMVQEQPESTNVALASAKSDDHAQACDPSTCGDEGQGEGHSGCPSGATSCCSTWGPPMDRLSVSPPTLAPVGLADTWLAIDESCATEKRASEVALFELARPPSDPTDALLAASLSRRGPPAL